MKKLLTILLTSLLIISNLLITNKVKANVSSGDVFDLTVKAETVNNAQGTFDYYIRFWNEETPTQEGIITLNVSFVKMSGYQPARLSSNASEYDYSSGVPLTYKLYKGDDIATATLIKETSSFPGEGWTYDSASNIFSYVFKNAEAGENYFVKAPDDAVTVYINDDETTIETEYKFNEEENQQEKVTVKSASINGTVSFTHEVDGLNVIALPNKNILNALTDLFKVNKVYAEGDEVPFVITDPPKGVTEAEGETGAYKFSLNTNDEMVFADLPAGVNYEVYELKSDGSRANVNDDLGNGFKLIKETKTSGTISDGTTATFINEPNKYEITYKYEGNYPQEVFDTLPNDNNKYYPNSIVNPLDPTNNTIETENGIYTFVGWDKDNVTITNKNEEFIGKWTYEAKEVKTYNVKYEYKGNLPKEVLDTLPIDDNTYPDKTIVKALEPNNKSITINDITYIFEGWDEESKTINGNNITFTGKWRTVKKEEHKPIIPNTSSK